MKQHLELVENLLENNPELRDSDLRLVANIWWMTLNTVLRHKFQGYELDEFKILLDIYAKGDLPNEQSIRRIRRKLQEEKPELRGKIYELRHQKEAEYKEDISSWWNDSSQHNLFDRD